MMSAYASRVLIVMFVSSALATVAGKAARQGHGEQAVENNNALGRRGFAPSRLCPIEADAGGTAS